MQFMVISDPRPGKPSDARSGQAGWWDWVARYRAEGVIRECYIKAGRGAALILDVDSHETLHRLINEWQELVPASFTTHALIDPAYQERRARGT